MRVSTHTRPASRILSSAANNSCVCLHSTRVKVFGKKILYRMPSITFSLDTTPRNPALFWICVYLQITSFVEVSSGREKFLEKFWDWGTGPPSFPPFPALPPSLIPPILTPLGLSRCQGECRFSLWKGPIILRVCGLHHPGRHWRWKCWRVLLPLMLSLCG